MSDAELLEAMRIHEERRIALAEAEENLHVGIMARQFRREIQTASPPRLLTSPAAAGR